MIKRKRKKRLFQITLIAILRETDVRRSFRKFFSIKNFILFQQKIVILFQILKNVLVNIICFIRSSITITRSKLDHDSPFSYINFNQISMETKFKTVFIVIKFIHYLDGVENFYIVIFSYDFFNGSL